MRSSLTMFKRPCLAALILFLSSPFIYAQDEPGAQVQAAESGSSEQQIDEFSLTGHGEKGERTWDISGKTADIFDDVVKLKQVEGNLYGEEEDIKLLADRGNFNKKSGLVHVEDNVVITTSSGARLATDALDWDRRNKIISTEDKVDIRKDNMVTYATGAFGQPDLNNIKLKKDVQVNINPVEAKDPAAMEAERTVITCDGPLEIDYLKSKATFNDNVKVDRKDMDIYGDIMDVYFSKNEEEKSSPKEGASIMGNDIDKVDARGNVKIVRGENVSYSQRAVYSSDDKKIMLSGRPRLVIYSKEDLSAAFGD
ncbi:LPS export ABC transporter periplasmic protein LptC [Candidatus Omnitrophota bacterium]